MVINIYEILKLLPHRYPFLLIDRVEALTPDQSIVALKNVSMNEHYFTGHFPEKPIMPGVLILECLAQAGAVLAYYSKKSSPNEILYYFAGIDKVRFRRVVEPGDQLRLEVKLLKAKRDFWKMEGSAFVEEDLACSAEFISAGKLNQ